MKKLDDLAAVIPPPADPKVTLPETTDWLELFASIGTRLPEDFVQFHKHYGDGYFYSLSHKASANITVYGGTRSFSFRKCVPARLSELRIQKERRPKSVPASLYWEPNGLLPWGNTTNDTDLCWQVHGELVDNWPVVALRTASLEIETYDLSMTVFLKGIIDGSIQSSLMPQGLPGAKGVAWAPWRFG